MGQHSHGSESYNPTPSGAGPARRRAALKGGTTYNPGIRKLPESLVELLLDPAVWMAFLTLTALEIVLGIDNIIFIAILVNRLPEHLRAKARYFGLSLAMVTRILLLLSLAWIMRLTEPFFTVFEQGISGRDIILIGGGLFLLWKSTMEIHASLEGADGEEEREVKGAPTFFATLIQIALIDIVFSFDSVITAVGLVNQIPVMVAAIVAAVGVMMFAAGPISDFVDRHPSIKMLALSFLVVIGVVLIAEGFDVHVPKGYIYFAMAFSVMVEMLNIRMRRGMKQEPVKLHKKLDEAEEAERS
nr:integral membrane protein TerC [uncultured bacterium]